MQGPNTAGRRTPRSDWLALVLIPILMLALAAFSAAGFGQSNPLVFTADGKSLICMPGRSADRRKVVVLDVASGEVRATLDVRHAGDDVRAAAVARMMPQTSRGVTVAWQQTMDEPAMALAHEPVARAVKAAGFPVHHMPSGAGHDAMIIGRKVPASMLFLRSPGGISHHPDETVLEEDVAAALAAGAEFIENWRPV